MREARHPLIKEIGLGRVTQMTAWKKILDDRISKVSLQSQ
jgi:hypothetical protein